MGYGIAYIVTAYGGIEMAKKKDSDEERAKKLRAELQALTGIKMTFTWERDFWNPRDEKRIEHLKREIEKIEKDGGE